MMGYRITDGISLVLNYGLGRYNKDEKRHGVKKKWRANNNKNDAGIKGDPNFSRGLFDVKCRS
jgi:hypothetical protein